jgi:hypothetical protein
MKRSFGILTLVCLGSVLALAAYAGDRGEVGMAGSCAKHPTLNLQSSCGQGGIQMGRACAKPCGASSMCGRGSSTGIWYRGGPRTNLADWLEDSCCGHHRAHRVMIRRCEVSERCREMGVKSGCCRMEMKQGCGQMMTPGCGQMMKQGCGSAEMKGAPWSNHPTPGMGMQSGQGKCRMVSPSATSKPGCCAKGAKAAQSPTPSCGAKK